MLYFEDYLYKVAQKGVSTTTWRCTSVDTHMCKVRLTTSKNEAVFNGVLHSHQGVERNLSQAVYSRVLKIGFKQAKTRCTFYFFPGAKNPMLYYDHFMYKVLRKMPESTHWLCVSYNSSKCKAAIKTSKDGALLLNTEHNHPPADRDPKKSVYSCVMQVSRKRRRSYGSLSNQRIFYYTYGRKHPTLHYENYKYKLVNHGADHTTWRCVASDCRGRIKTGEDFAIILNNVHLHKRASVDLKKAISRQVLKIIA
ncbi:FLYWCH zinc finger domain [Popillia japonica]|uniref:FLYWCH zinc finger domain n=1 Tax=Popillia japonica TaxID=7064 RepID=A0AAW1MIF0_POPJA